MATVSMTVHPFVTVGVGVPRAVSMRFPQGDVFGVPFQAEQQLQIITSALRLLETAEEPRTIMQWPYRWRAGRPQ